MFSAGSGVALIAKFQPQTSTTAKTNVVPYMSNKCIYRYKLTDKSHAFLIHCQLTIKKQSQNNFVVFII